MGGVFVYIYSGGWSVMATPVTIWTRMTSNDFELTMIPCRASPDLSDPSSDSRDDCWRIVIKRPMICKRVISVS